MKFKIGDSIGFRPSGTEVCGVHYDGPKPSLWSGFVNGEPMNTHVPVWCDRLGGLEATTIMVATSNIETVNGKRFAGGASGYEKETKADQVTRMHKIIASSRNAK